MKVLITIISITLLTNHVFAGGADDFITCKSLNSDYMIDEKVDVLDVTTRQLEADEIGEAGNDFRLSFFFNGVLIGTGDTTEPEANSQTILNGYTYSNGNEELSITINLLESKIHIGAITLNNFSCSRI